MNTIHEKSPCCGDTIWRRGKRRRQCRTCGRTWRSWKRKVGRKEYRPCFDELIAYLKHEKGSLRQQAARKHITPAGFQKRMKATLSSFNKNTAWSSAPDGHLIAIADAMIEYINGIGHTVYLILLRELNGNKAIIAPFSVRINEGEGLAGWKWAFAQLPPSVHERIRVVVCDGVNALGTIANEEGWILQRCHFHLLARLAHNCSQRRFGKNPMMGKRIQKLAQIVLTHLDEAIMQLAIEELRLIRMNTTSRSFRTVLSGFIKHYDHYRSYLNFPEYHIPTTSNSAEFLIGQIRDLQYRARGFRTLKSLTSWMEAYCKLNKSVTCNGSLYAPN